MKNNYIIFLLVGEKFKEALKTVFTNGPTAQQSFRHNNSRSTIRQSNKPNCTNTNDIELRRVQAMQSQHIILEIEWE
jgi:hypothetical protein